jgi:Flp pilus assembly protein TadD
VADGVARAKEALASEPNSMQAHFVLGGLYLQQGDLPLAIEALTVAARLDPNSAATHSVLGRAYERKGDLARALEQYKRVIALTPQSPVGYNNVAWLYARQAKNLDEALALAQKAQELAPNSGAVLDTLGWVHYQRGEYTRAEPILKKATGLLTSNATLFYHLGMTYYKLGRREDAAAALRRSLQLQETIPQAEEIRALLVELRQ